MKFVDDDDVLLIIIIITYKMPICRERMFHYLTPSSTCLSSSCYTILFYVVCLSFSWPPSSAWPIPCYKPPVSAIRHLEFYIYDQKEAASSQFCQQFFTNVSKIIVTRRQISRIKGAKIILLIYLSRPPSCIHGKESVCCLLYTSPSPRD